jgi:Putative peptidoglycan binding domain
MIDSHRRATCEQNNLDDCLNKFDSVTVKVCNYEVFMMFNARRLKMNRSAFSAVVVAAALGGSLCSAAGQMINPTVQTASPRVVAGRGAPVAAGKPIANARGGPQVAPRPTGLNPQRFNPNLPPTIAQPPANLQRTYSPIVRTPNFSVATLNAPRGGPVQQSVAIDPATRQTELRTLAAMHQRRGVVTRDGNVLDPARQNESHTASMRERRMFGDNNQTLATINPQRHVTNRDPEAGPQRDRHESPKDAPDKKWRHKKDHISHDEASRRHWHEWHDRNWWHNNCETIVFVTTGYYFLDGSYWYPAYGYDPLQTYYDYDGPVYTYSNLLPDEVIGNVQTALQNAGYYPGSITGSLSVDTRAAIANFQRDYGLPITGAIDEETVEALGLY